MNTTRWFLVALLAMLAILSVQVHANELEMDMDMEDELEVDMERRGHLERPLIDGVLSSPYKRDQIANVAEIVKAEPSIAKLDASSTEDDWNGEAEGEDRHAYEKKLKEELRSLTTLVKQSKMILAALPDKERRIEQVRNKLEALRNEYAKEDAILKYKQQRALMVKIARQEMALKERVDSLKKTESKLQNNIVQHKRTLRDVGVREQEMKILDM
jgi:hypothetical protein